MRKLILLLFTGILLFSCTAVGADEGRILRFIYCSDVHYGLEREFRGKEVGSDEVSRAMLATFKLLSETRQHRMHLFLEIKPWNNLSH